MSIPEVVACATLNAARAHRRPDIGTLKPGSLGEASLFEVVHGPTQYQDMVDEVMHSDTGFAARGLVLDGRWRT